MLYEHFAKNNGSQLQVHAWFENIMVSAAVVAVRRLYDKCPGSFVVHVSNVHYSPGPEFPENP